ncbi:MAG: hypothetical protein GY838_13005 [bacterium]|nr:hypothetical protein [bacterium]
MPTYEISESLDAWLRGTDRGISSNTIVEHIMGFPALGSWTQSHPHDAPDLGRCIRLLAVEPELRRQLWKMRSCSAVWAALVDRWDELTAVYLAEEKEPPEGECRTYKLMREIIDPIRNGPSRTRAEKDGHVHLRIIGDGMPTNNPGATLKKSEDG